MNEEENTFRALKDEPELATGRWCWVGFHKWTKWSKPFHRREGVYEIDYQIRHCDHCGEFQTKQLRKW
jgi:hypothetical protein